MKKDGNVKLQTDQLNQDDGCHHLPHMYDKLIKSCVTMPTPRQGTESVIQSQTEEGTRPGVERPL